MTRWGKSKNKQDKLFTSDTGGHNRAGQSSLRTKWQPRLCDAPSAAQLYHCFPDAQAEAVLTEGSPEQLSQHLIKIKYEL